MPTSDIKKGPLYVDSTNNRVGVGTSSPAYNLDVYNPASTGAPFLAQFKSAGGDTQLYVDNSTITTQLTADSTNSAGIVGTKTNHPFVFRTNNIERMRIDSSGRVTMPAQPVFFVKDLNFPGSNAAGTASGGSVLVNVGSHYATGTGRFTAPIAGTYVFYMMTQSYDSGNTTGQYQTAVFRKNGSTVGAEAYHGWQPNDGNNHVQVQNTVIITLAANDYMMAYVQYGSRDIQNYFGGYLLG